MSKKLCEQGYNDFYSVDDLPLTEDEKEMVLEWYAQKIWGGLQGRGHCKSYDPLIIEGKVAHSYIFNLNGLAYRTDGGRHHNFKTLVQLEERLENEMKESAKRYPEDSEVDLLKAKKLAKKLREYEISPAKSLAHWHDGNSKPCYESNCILTGFTSEPKATIQDVVNATPKGQAVVNKALVNAHASMEAVSEQASTLTELIEILNCDDGIIPLITGEDAAKVVNKLRSLIARKEREATNPKVDLNDTKYMLQFIDDPIEKFNMFIYKWCPHYSHLIDSDDNDGEEIRSMIRALQGENK